MARQQNPTVTQKFPYRFSGNLVLRTPQMPLPDHARLLTPEEIFRIPGFPEALWLATPGLYDEAIRWQEGHQIEPRELRKLHASLSKYFLRMSYRCTPFGLFSSTGLVNWQDEEQTVILDPTRLQRKTRLDMHYLCALAANLETIPEIRNRILFFPNSSLYRLGPEYRFIEYKYEEGKRMHQISAAAKNDFLDHLISAAEKGISFEKAVSIMITGDITTDEAISFVEDVIQSQILVSELEPAVTGGDFSLQVISILKKINTPAHPVIERYIQSLEKINQLIGEIDAGNTGDTAQYFPIFQLLDDLGIRYEPGKIFQTDAYRDPVSGGPCVTYQEDLKAAIQFLQRMNPPRDNPNLVAFTKKFNARFEGQEIPVLQALDTETGIAYASHKSPDPAPLKDDLVLPESGKELRVEMPEPELALFRLLVKAVYENKFELELKEDDFPAYIPPPGIWAPSLSVMFRMTDIDNRPLYLEMCGNNSANCLLSRFAGDHPGIGAAVEQIAKEEEQLNDEIIFAEIIHLPESRIGNILLRPSSRKYEIPFLGAASVTPDYTLPLGDLYLKAIQGKMYLYSRRLQKRIIPRLSAAHFFGNHSLPVYHFLCDLQSQGLQNSYSFSWGSLSGLFPFLPRVVYRNVILHGASWQLNTAEIKDLVKNLRTENLATIHAWLQERKIPDQFVLVEGDNELPVDIRNPNSLQALADAIHEKNHCLFRELLLPGKAIQDKQGKSFNGQYLATLMLEHTSYNGDFLNQYTPSAISQNRSFPPGSEWLYLKIYCGIKTAEEIIQYQAGPFTKTMMEKGLIRKWFFIRYFDTDFHIRLRIQLASPSCYTEVLQGLSEQLTPLLSEGLVSGWQIDTYHRETERYGEELMEETESLFALDSQLKLAFLDITEGDQREQVRWLFGLKCTDWLMDCLGFDEEQKVNLAVALKEIFAAEFNMNKFLGQQVNQRFNLYRHSIETAFGIRTGEDLLSRFYPVFNAFEPVFRELGARIRKKLETYRPEHTTSYTGSCIHMMLNRLFVSEPRLQEMVLYEFLHKVYQAKKYRQSGKA